MLVEISLLNFWTLFFFLFAFVRFQFTLILSKYLIAHLFQFFGFLLNFSFYLLRAYVAHLGHLDLEDSLPFWRILFYTLGS